MVGQTIAAASAAPTTPVQSVSRAARLLRHLAQAGPGGLGLRDVSAAVALNRSTTHSLLRALLAEGLVEQTGANGNYRIGPEVLHLSRTYLGGNGWAEVIEPVLAALLAASQETVHLAVLQGDRTTVIRLLNSAQPVVVSPTTIREPRLYCTSIGKVLLAHAPPATAARLLDEIEARGFVAYSPRTITSRGALELELERVRREGFAGNAEEGRPGVVGQAAPVRDHTGATVATLGVMYPAIRSTAAYDGRMADLVRQAGLEASVRLGWRSADGRAMAA